jgi:hypothetical protein
MRPLLNKYPFSPNAKDQATLRWRHYLDTAFQTFLDQATTFRDAVFEGGSPDPHLSYMVKPVFSSRDLACR